jgi:hypothetical protein
LLKHDILTLLPQLEVEGRGLDGFLV